MTRKEINSTSTLTRNSISNNPSFSRESISKTSSLSRETILQVFTSDNPATYDETGLVYDDIQIDYDGRTPIPTRKEIDTITAPTRKTIN